MKRRVWLLAGMVPLLAWSQGTPEVVEIELRWVTQPVVAPGTLSTGATQAHLDYLGPGVRVQLGERATWRLLEPPLGWQFSWMTQHQGAQIRLQVPTGAPRFWELGLTATRRTPKEPVSVALEWSQPEGAGGEQHWRTRLPLQLDHWTVIARDGHNRLVHRDGSLRTGEAGVLRELQLRLRTVVRE